MICHPDEVVNFDSMGDAQIDKICHPDEVISFDSMGDAQSNMICHPDENFSVPVQAAGLLNSDIPYVYGAHTPNQYYARPRTLFTFYYGLKLNIGSNYTLLFRYLP